MKECLWGLRYLLKNDKFEWLEDKGKFLFDSLKSENPDIVLPSLKIIVDISAGPEELTDVIFNL